MEKQLQVWAQMVFIMTASVVNKGELRLSGNHNVTENEMSGEPYSKKNVWIKHSMIEFSR